MQLNIIHGNHLRQIQRPMDAGQDEPRNLTDLVPRRTQRGTEDPRSDEPVHFDRQSPIPNEPNSRLPTSHHGGKLISQDEPNAPPRDLSKTNPNSADDLRGKRSQDSEPPRTSRACSLPPRIEGREIVPRPGRCLGLDPGDRPIPYPIHSPGAPSANTQFRPPTRNEAPAEARVYVVRLRGLDAPYWTTQKMQ